MLPGSIYAWAMVVIRLDASRAVLFGVSSKVNRLLAGSWPTHCPPKMDAAARRSPRDARIRRDVEVRYVGDGMMLNGVS